MSTSLQLASCLINAWPLPAHPGYNELGSDQWAVRSSFGCIFYWTRFIWQQCAIRQYHFDLSDQSAMEIRDRIRVRLRVALFLHFFAENNENDHLIFCEFYVRQHLAKRMHPNDQQQNEITHYIGSVKEDTQTTTWQLIGHCPFRCCQWRSACLC